MDRPTPGTRERIRQAALVLIAIVACAAAMRAARIVLIPLFIAIFVAVTLWPLHRALSRRMPAWAAATMAGGGLFVGAGGVAAGVALIFGSAQADLAGSMERAREGLRQAARWMDLHGVPSGWVPADPAAVLAPLGSFAGSGLHGVPQLLAAAVLTLFLALLALWEAPRWEARLERVFGRERARVVCDGFHEASRDFARYVVATTISGACAGTLTAALCWIVGVPMALVWGLLSFLLNYVPNLGVFVSAVPPALLAFAYAGPGGGAAMVVGLFVIEMLTGNVLAPILTGRAMGLSPMTVLGAVLLWGWLWGAAGALLAAPITVAIVIAMRRYAPTRPVAELLIDREARHASRHGHVPPLAAAAPHTGL